MSFFSPGSVDRNDYGHVVITSPLAISRLGPIILNPVTFLLATASLLATDPVTEFTYTLIGILLCLTAATTQVFWRNTTWGETIVANGYVTVHQKRLFVANRIFQIKASDIVAVEQVIRHGRPLGWYRQVIVSTGGSTVLATGPISKRAAINAEGAIRSAMTAARAATHDEVVRF